MPPDKASPETRPTPLAEGSKTEDSARFGALGRNIRLKY